MSGETIDDLVVLQSVILGWTGVVFLPSQLLELVPNLPLAEFARFDTLELTDV